MDPQITTVTNDVASVWVLVKQVAVGIVAFSVTLFLVWKMMRLIRMGENRGTPAQQYQDRNREKRMFG